jgi:hypothetical protein
VRADSAHSTESPVECAESALTYAVGLAPASPAAYALDAQTPIVSHGPQIAKVMPLLDWMLT